LNLEQPSVEYVSAHNRVQLAGTAHAEVLEASYNVRQGQFKRAYGSEERPKLVISTEDFIDAMQLDFTMNNVVDRVTVWPTPLLPSEELYDKLVGRKRKGNKEVYLL
jgi:hypothetical protein